jgi:hypothetical protein
MAHFRLQRRIGKFRKSRQPATTGAAKFLQTSQLDKSNMSGPGGQNSKLQAPLVLVIWNFALV